jgi:fatty acid desaturase
LVAPPKLKSSVNKYPIRPWRTAYDILACWTVIAASIVLVLHVSWWLYPIAAVLIANRMLALSLLCHEGLHANLHPNLKVNDFIGRYFCAFPTFISFSKYRRLHLLHHGTVGSAKWDPDRHLFNKFPMKPSSFLLDQFARLITLRTLLDFMMYYSEFPELFRRKRLANGKLFVLSSRSDLIPFICFYAVLIGWAFATGHLLTWFLFVSAPVILITQPYVLLMGGLQHGPVRAPGADSGVSRTVRGSKLYMWLVLPVDICYHAEHHLNAGVPHYWLSTYASELESEGRKLWRGSYREALRDLFSA